MAIVETSEVTSVADDGYARIRADIIFGRLKPSQRLRLEVLRQDYGLSVTTLREVLNRLASDRLVVAEGKRGFEVAPISVENLKELADLRLILECHALDQSFARADVEWEGRVVSAHHKLAATEKLMTVADRLDRAMEAIRQRIPSGIDLKLRLGDADGNACGDVRSIFSIPDDHLRVPRRGACAQHRALLDCALKRDADGQENPEGTCRRLCEAHDFPLVEDANDYGSSCFLSRTKTLPVASSF